MTDSVLEYAHGYAKAGIYVFPLYVKPGRDGKKDVRPAVLWRQASSISGADIEAWWGPGGSHTTAGIGIDCGRSELVVVDCDGAEGIANWAALDPPPPLCIVKTPGGGEHWYYGADPDHLIGNDQDGKVAPHVDVRGVGGLVIAAPTVDWRGQYELGMVADGWVGRPVPAVVIERMKAKPAAPVSQVAPSPSQAVEDADDLLQPVQREFTREQAIRFVRDARAKLAATHHGLNGAINAFAMQCAHFPWLVTREQCAAHVIRAIGEREGWTAPDEQDRKTINSAYSATEAGRSWVAVEVQEAEPAPEAPAKKPVNTDNSFTDSALTEALADEVMADRYVWNGAMGWQEYTGVKWQDADEVQTGESVRIWARDHYKAALRAELADPGSAVNAVAGWRKVQSASRISAVLKLSRGVVFTPAELFDLKPDEFNTPSGVLELATGELRAPAALDYCTKVAGGTFDPAATSQLFDAFVQRILPDPDVREFVQRLMGYAMLGVVREHVLPIFTGTGANGKGTLRDAVMAAFGDYATEVDPEILLSQAGSGRHLTFLMNLRGRRLVFCSETEKERNFSEATMKRLTGGDPIEANRMHKDPITFDPTHTLIMCTNHLPRISADDDAVWRRVRVVPFDVVIPEAERDGELPEKLKGPDVRAAVLAWTYRGFQQYQLLGLAAPDAVKMRTSGYRSDNDLVGRFLEEKVVFGASCSMSAADLYRGYEAWCAEEGIPPLDRLAKRDFGVDMVKRGHQSIKRAGAMIYSGLMIEASDQDHANPF